MRKLASIEKILDIQPIEGADRIELAKVKGWQVVVKKGDFKIGDMCIYFEIDSILPKRQAFEFLGNYSKKYNGYRIRTMKLRGVLSQGLVMPLDFEEMSIMELGDDITEALGVKKYEIEILDKKIKGDFPEFLEKTDEERIQNLPEYFEKYKGQEFYVTEKLDGQSITYYCKDGHFGICSRNRELVVEENMPEMKIAKKCGIEDSLRKQDLNGTSMAIQGEMVGPGIQGNRLDLKEKEFRVFNLWHINSQENGCWLELEKMEGLKVRSVPIVMNTDRADFYNVKKITLDEYGDMETLIKDADGVSDLNRARLREGWVFRLADDPSVSFKVVSNEYLLKYDTGRRG